MFDDGFTDMTSVDYSEVVIEKMQAQFRAAGKALKFEVMDVRDIKYKDETFDCIIDKGTLDAILCGSDSAKNAGQMLSECQRVLKKGGFFFVITYGQPQSRLNYLEKSRYKWKVSYQLLGKTRYMYVMENVDPGRTGGTPYDD
jgi:ubiquinone/menaquinone biosynthesis C-methylase UbiE